MTFRLRVGLLLTLVTGVTVATMSAFVYLLFAFHLKEAFYAQLESRAQIAAQTRYGAEEMSAAIYQEIREKHFQTLPEEKEAFFEILPNNTIRKEVEGFHPTQSFVNKVLNDGRAEGRDEFGNTQVGVIYTTHGSRHIVVMSARDGYGTAMLTDLLKLLLLAVVAVVVVTFLIALWLAESIISPISRMAEKLANITASNLHERLPLDTGERDEVGMLKATFNEMLNRLETAFELQDSFISNASHELRNPLTAIIGETEVALTRSERSTAEYRATLEKVLAEASRLETLVSALLQLAQARFDRGRFVLSDLRIDELIFEVKSSMAAISPRSQVNVVVNDLPADADLLLVRGNEGLLRIALSNIIHNACKFSHGKPVDVILELKDGRLLVRVIDRGMGIAKDDLPKVFEPFFRSEKVRAIGGFGIGLPLTQRIVRMHGGKIDIASSEGTGTEVSLSLPHAELSGLRLS